MERHGAIKIIDMIKLLQILLFFFFVTSSAFGQVATPYLDTVLPTELSSANSWRFGSTFGGEQIYSDQESKTEKAELYNSRSAALIAYQPTQVSFELFAFTNEVDYNWDPSTDTFQETKGNASKLGISIRGKRQFSVGVGFESSTQEQGTSKQEKKSYGGSFSLRTFDNLYLAAGLERVTLAFDQGNELKWDKVVSGIALQTGEPGGSIFRIEINGSLSPKVESDNNSHQKTTVIQGSVEWLWDGYLLSYRNASTTEEALNSSEEDTKNSTHRYGLGIKFENISFGFYRTAGLIKYGSKDVVSQRYRATFGFSFI